MKTVLILVLSLILTGCGNDIDTSTIKKIYKSTGQFDKYPVKDVEDIECKISSYTFPEEKKRPLYKCSYTLVFTRNNEIKKVKEMSIIQEHEPEEFAGLPEAKQRYKDERFTLDRSYILEKKN